MKCHHKVLPYVGTSMVTLNDQNKPEGSYYTGRIRQNNGRIYLIRATSNRCSLLGMNCTTLLRVGSLLSVRITTHYKGIVTSHSDGRLSMPSRGVASPLEVCRVPLAPGAVDRWLCRMSVPGLESDEE